MLNSINDAGKSITVGNIKILNEKYNKEQLVRAKVIIDTLSLAKNSYTDILEMESDSKVTPVEKIQLKSISDNIDNEQALLFAKYTDYNLTGNSSWTTYNTKYTTLHDLLVLILADMSTTYDLGATSLSTAFSEYYTARKNAENTLSEYLQLVIAKVSQFGIQLNTATFDGAADDPGTIYVHGFDGSGDAADSVNGNIYYLGARVTVNYGAHVTGFTDKQGYLYVPSAGGAIGSCYYHAGDNMFKTSAEVEVSQATNLVIGEFTASATGVIGPLLIYSTAKPFSQLINTEFMNLLASSAATSTDFNNMLVNLGITFFTNLAAANLWVKNFEAANMKVGLGSETSGFMFRANYSNGDPLTGTPQIDVWSGGVCIFKIVCSGANVGDIYFGDFNNGGLMFDASTGQIKSKNDNLIIGTDGQIIAQSGTWSGDLSIGQIETIDGHVLSEATSNYQNTLFSFLSGEKNMGTILASPSPVFTRGRTPSPSQLNIDTRNESITTQELAGHYKTNDFVYIGSQLIAFTNDGGNTWSDRVLSASSLLSIGRGYQQSLSVYILSFSGSNTINVTSTPYNSANDNIVTVGGTGEYWYGVKGIPYEQHGSLYWIMGGNNGNIAYTTDFNPTLTGDWTVITKGTNTWYKSDINPTTGRIVIVGGGGNIGYFDDAASIAAVDITVVSVSSVDWKRVHYCPNIERWIASGDSSIAYSDDGGVSWTVVSMGEPIYDVAVDEIHNRFFAIADQTLYYSWNAIEWENISVGTGINCRSLHITDGDDSANIKLIIGGNDAYNCVWSSDITSETISISRIVWSEIRTGEMKITFDDTASKNIIVFNKNILNTFAISATFDSKLLLKKNLLVESGLKIEDTSGNEVTFT